MSQRVIGKIPLGVEGWGREPPQSVDPLLSWLAAAAVVVSESKSFFDLAENCEASSLWVGRHRYTRVLQVSKLIWV